MDVETITLIKITIVMVLALFSLRKASGIGARREVRLRQRREWGIKEVGMVGQDKKEDTQASTIDTSRVMLNWVEHKSDLKQLIANSIYKGADLIDQDPQIQDENISELSCIQQLRSEQEKQPLVIGGTLKQNTEMQELTARQNILQPQPLRRHYNFSKWIYHPKKKILKQSKQ